MKLNEIEAQKRIIEAIQKQITNSLQYQIGKLNLRIWELENLVEYKRGDIVHLDYGNNPTKVEILDWKTEDESPHSNSYFSFTRIFTIRKVNGEPGGIEEVSDNNLYPIERSKHYSFVPKK